MKKTTMTPTELRQHVDEICKAFQIDVLYDARLSYESAHAILLKDHFVLALLELSPRMVHAHPIVDEATYAVVMHEIGHHTAPNGFCRVPKPEPGAHPRVTFEFLAAMLVCEEAAWEWAQYYIEQQFIWTAAMEQVKQFGLSGYTRARQRGGR